MPVPWDAPSTPKRAYGLGQSLGKAPNLLLYRAADDSDVDVDSLRPAGLGQRGHSQVLERVANDDGGLKHPVEPGALHRVEIEMEIVGTVDIVTACVPGIEIDAAEVHHPEQRFMKNHSP